MNFPELASAATQLLAPFLPAILGKVTETATTAAGELAHATWNTLKPLLITQDGTGPDVTENAEALSEKPGNPTREKNFAASLAAFLDANPDAATKLQALFANKPEVLREIARNELGESNSLTIKATDGINRISDNKAGKGNTFTIG